MNIYTNQQGKDFKAFVKRMERRHNKVRWAECWRPYKVIRKTITAHYRKANVRG